LNEIIIVAGALGFTRKDGRISRWLEDPSRSDDMEVVLLPPPSTTDVLAQSGGGSGGGGDVGDGGAPAGPGEPRFAAF
jgi:hypothetical protein